MNKLPSTMNNSNNKQSNLEWRRNRIVELYSEGRNQSQIAQILKISQPTVFRDLQYQRRQSRNKVKTYLDEYVPFEHNTCQVEINKILRKAWDIINDDDSSENAVFKALSLAKDCYIVKNDLLGDKTVIERVIEFVSSYNDVKQLEVQSEIDNFYANQTLEEQNRSLKKYVTYLGLKSHQLHINIFFMTNKYERQIRFDFHDSLSLTVRYTIDVWAWCNELCKRQICKYKCKYSDASKC